VTIKSSFSCPVEEASGAVYDMVVLFSYETWLFFYFFCFFFDTNLIIYSIIGLRYDILRKNGRRSRNGSSACKNESVMDKWPK